MSPLDPSGAWLVPDDSLRTAGILAKDRILVDPLRDGEVLRPGWVVLARYVAGLRVQWSLFRVVEVLPLSPTRADVVLDPLAGGSLRTGSREDVLGRARALLRALAVHELRQVVPGDAASPATKIADLARELGRADPLLGQCLLGLAAAASAGGGWLDRMAAAVAVEGQILLDFLEAPLLGRPGGQVH